MLPCPQGNILIFKTNTYLWAGLLKRYRPLTAIILSAFLFGLVHLNPVQFMSAFPLGLFFGWLYYKTESVLPCILGHFSVNLMGFYLRFTLKTEDFWQETVWSVSQWLYVFMLILLLGAAVYGLSRIFKKEGELHHEGRVQAENK